MDILRDIPKTLHKNLLAFNYCSLHWKPNPKVHNIHSYFCYQLNTFTPKHLSIKGNNNNQKLYSPSTVTILYNQLSYSQSNNYQLFKENRKIQTNRNNKQTSQKNKQSTQLFYSITYIYSMVNQELLDKKYPN